MSKKKKPVRGATRSGKRERTGALVRVMKMASKFVVLPALVLVGLLQVDWLSLRAKVEGVANKPLANIRIEGAFEYITRAQVQAMVSDSLDGKFVDLDLAQVKNIIEASPWVETAQLKRVWPDSLLISVKEQTPIARWGNSGFINQYGEMVEAETLEKLQSLPLLYGRESQSNEIARTYMDMSRLLSRQGLQLRGLQVDSTKSWELVIDDGILIVLGQDDVLEKLKNFLLVYEEKLASVKHKIKKVDLRYQSGLAVEWQGQQPKINVASAER